MKKDFLNKGFLQNFVAVFVALLLIFSAYIANFSKFVYAESCSAYNGDEVSCNGQTGCVWDIGNCSDFNWNQSGCEANAGCAYPGSAGDCSVLDESSCSSTGGCTANTSNCAWNGAGCVGGLGCDFYFDEWGCSTATYYSGCSGNFDDGSCTGTYYPGTCSGDFDTTSPILSEFNPVSTPTNDSTPDYTFSTDESGVITYGGSCTSETTNAVDGQNTITLSGVSSSFTEGTYSDCTIIVTDAYGNLSEELAISSFSIDLTAPVPPEVPDMTSDTDLGRDDSDNLTSDRTPTFAGVCDSENSVELYIDGILDGSGELCGGSFSLTPHLPLSEGSHSITAKVTDPAGNTSSASDPLTVTIDTTPPDTPETAPDMDSFTDLGSSSVDDITNDTTPSFAIECTNGNTVQLYEDAVASGDPVYCESNGGISLTTGTLSEGDNTITYRETDPAGNISDDSPNLDIIIDTTAPTTTGAPDMTSATDSGSSSTDNVTADNTPTFTGVCTDGNLVLLYDDASLSTYATCDSSTFSLTTGALAGGVHSITFKETDVAGNVSSASSALSVTIDTTAPVFSSVTPATSTTINSVTSSSDIAYTTSEALGSGYIAITRTSGTADASSPRTCILTGSALNSGAHTAFNISDTTNGCVSDVSNLVSGAVYTFVFAGSDLAGNGAASITRTGVTFDNTLPTITSVSSDKAAGAYTVGEVIDIDVTFSEAVTSTGDVTVTLETGATDRTCTFAVSNTTTGTCNYTVQAGDTSSDLTVGSISGTITDVAGNTMSNFVPITNLAANETLVVDTTAPVISEVTAITSPTTDSTPDYIFTASEAGVITYGGSCSSATNVASSGNNTITLVALDVGTYSDCTITVTDASGNVSDILVMTSFAVAATVTETPSDNSSGGGNGNNGSSRSSGSIITVSAPSPINVLIDVLSDFVPKFLKPSKPEEDIVVSTPTPKKPQLGLEGGWNLIPKSIVDEFVLGNLPSEITDLISKFPELRKVFASVGVSNISDLNKLQDVKFNLPKIADKKNPPTEVVFAVTGEGQIDVSSSLDILDDGTINQKINTLGGKPITLQIKPEGKADSVKGCLTFKRKDSVTVANFSTSSRLASAIIAVGSLGERKKISQEKPELLIFGFEYTDPDQDGIYTANIETPQAEGEYEVITVIDYTDKNKGSKELRMVTVIDPEGYIYEKDSRGREIRIGDATVSLFEVKSSGESLWDAKKYSQDNPQTTDKTGKYAFLVPEGRYFLTVESDDHNFYKGMIFEVKEGNPVHENIELVKKHAWLYDLFDWKVGAILLILAIYITRFINHRKKII